MVGSFFISRVGNLDFVPDIVTGKGISYIAVKQLDNSIWTGMELDFLRVRKALTLNFSIPASEIDNDLGWTAGAEWGVNLDAIPLRFTNALPASGDGLIITPDAMGYYTDAGGTVHMKTYMDNAGNFYLAGTNASLTWDASTDTLDIQGGTFTGSELINFTSLAGGNNGNDYLIIESAAYKFDLRYGGSRWVSAITGTPGGGAQINGNEIATESWVNTNYDTFPGFGTSGSTACIGNDARLSDARNAADVYSWAKAAAKPTYTYSEVGAAASSHTHSASQITDFSAAVENVVGGEIGEYTVQYKDWGGVDRAINVLYHP